ncbi:hypothetical protein [Avibacterium avium]|uniref:hypothetical protein n=1 Tax=Avibacterium avium TaxID=751 RepID=UPI003BF911C5
MKKITALLGLLFSPMLWAGNFGTEVMSEMIYSVYEECNQGKLGELSRILEIPKAQFCGCFISQIQNEFEHLGLEQKLNEGNMTIKQLENAMENIGEMSSEYCIDKLSPEK